MVAQEHLRQELRQAMKARRSALRPAERIACAQAVASHLLSQQAMQEARDVAGYWAVEGELPLSAVATNVAAMGTYLLPKLGPEGTLRFAPWSPRVDLVPNRYGIPEPSTDLKDCLTADQLDLILVPLLAFDAHGNRLGMGGGWYDRSLAYRLKGRAKPFLVGVAYAFQQVDAVPAEPWDIPLDAVVTESGIIRTQ